MKKYLKIIAPHDLKSEKTHFLKNFLKKICFLLLPKQNPVLENTISNIVYWLIEFKNSLPIQEIGLDNKSNILCKMPFKNNYGYWTDNSLLYEDFLKKFSIGSYFTRIFGKKLGKYLNSFKLLF